jgi:hypothetical protein
LSLLTIAAVESNSMPLTMHRRSFDHRSSLASHTLRHALTASRMLALLPRNHEPENRGYDSEYDREGYRSEGDSSRGGQQEGGHGDGGEIEDIGVPPGHRHSSPGPGDSDEGTPSRTLDDDRFRPYSDDSPGDSEADHFPHRSPYASTNNNAGRPEHNHPASGSTQDTLGSDEVSNSPQTHHTDDRPHELDPAPHQGQEPSPEETTPSEHAASSSISEGSSMICSILSQLYRRLDGPVWHNQGGWKDTTAPHLLRTRDHEGSRASQRAFRTGGQMEEGTTNGEDEGPGDDGNTNPSTTGNRNEDPEIVEEGKGDPSCCAWFGVTCRGSRVIGLALAGNGLDGPYPTDIIQSMVDLETM